MSQQISAADRFRAFAVRSGIDENDPMLVRAVEALEKIKRGESSSEEVDTALDPLFEAWNKEVREASPRAVAMPADSNSFRAAPLLDWAKEAGIDGSDPLLARALKAQEKADWRTSWASWLEMEIAVQAFVQAHFEIKNAWPPDSGQIEEFLQKLEKGNLTTSEIKEFRWLASEVLRDWQPEYSPAFKKRIESAISVLGPTPGEDANRKYHRKLNAPTVPLFPWWYPPLRE